MVLVVLNLLIEPGCGAGQLGWRLGFGELIIGLVTCVACDNRGGTWSPVLWMALGLLLYFFYRH